MLKVIKMLKNSELSCFQTHRCCFIILINVKMPTTTVGILTFISMINFHAHLNMKKMFISSGPWSGLTLLFSGLAVRIVRTNNVDYPLKSQEKMHLKNDVC